MSMSRSVQQELCEYIQQKPSLVLGNKFFDYRVTLLSEVSYKGDKFEPKIFVISKFRIFLLSGKSPSSLKIDRSYHILNVKSLSIVKEDEVAVSFEEAGHKKRYVIKTPHVTAAALIKHILGAFLRYFPDIGPQLRSTVELTPEHMYDEFSTMTEDVAPRACHSFRRTYAALCDFYDQPYREEVSWDIEKIYAVNRLRSLRIDDFSHLLPKDLIPITGVLQYSSYFTGLVADGIRMTSEVIDVLMSVIRKSRHLQVLQLRNCALPRDFITLFSSALQQNTSIPLEFIDFSKNVLDDKKGFTILTGVLPRLTTLRQVVFSECGLSEKCTQLFCAGIYSALTAKSNSGAVSSLTHLNLSTNLLKDDVSSLVNVLSLCTTLRVLDLTDTGFPLDKIWAALKYGGLQIEKLYLGGCYAGKRPAECVQQVKEYFSMAVNLSHISFANTVLPAELMKAMLLGLASNQQLKPYHLDLSGTCEKNCCGVLEACLGNVQCSSISLRDNNMETEMQAVVHALANIKTMRRLDLGGSNLIALRRSSKQAHAVLINKTILDIVKLFSDDSPLEELILSDARLGPHLSVLLNTLGATTSLRLLDISNNDLGHFGARILSKALQLNVSLRTVIIDNNHLGVEGLVDIATAVSMNKTLTAIPYPVQDVCECLTRAGIDRSRVLSAMSQLETCLERNRLPSNSDSANIRINTGSIDPEFLDKWNGLGDILSNSTEAYPSRLADMVDDFVEQVRREGRLNLQETLAGLGVSAGDAVPNAGKAERIAVSRLKELWSDELRRVFSDWRWRELCEQSGVLAEKLGIGADGTSSNSASQNGSPRHISSPHISQRSTDSVNHRPRSIIGDLHSPLGTQFPRDEEPGISLDSPPQPSALIHLQKSRPKAQRRSGGGGQEEIPMSRSTDIEEEAESTKSEDSGAGGDVVVKKPLSERAGFRAAMLPDAALLSQAVLRSAADRTMSPKPESPVHNSGLSSPLPSASPRIVPEADSPPPLPHRMRSLPSAAPSLPPKPVSRVSQLAPSAQISTELTDIDDENANNRRSGGNRLSFKMIPGGFFIQSLSKGLRRSAAYGFCTEVPKDKTHVLFMHFGLPRSQYYAKNFLRKSASLYYNLPKNLERFIPSYFLLNGKITDCIDKYGEGTYIEKTLDRFTNAVQGNLNTIMPEFNSISCSNAYLFEEPSIADALEDVGRNGCSHVLMVPLYPHFSCAMSGFLLNEVERSLQTFTIPSTVDGRELPDERIVPNTSNSFHVSTVHRWSNHPIVSEYWIDILQRHRDEIGGVVFCSPNVRGYNSETFRRSVWSTCERITAGLDDSFPWRLGFFNSWDQWNVPIRDSVKSQTKRLSAQLGPGKQIAVVPVTSLLPDFNTFSVLPRISQSLDRVLLVQPEPDNPLLIQGVVEVIKNHLLGRRNSQLQDRCDWCINKQCESMRYMFTNS
ncbi:hypothetical protein Q1695_010278 [Nippostrongylus brasiliensis]|nr:hypothetical protein Q1695_010278 [Nippostrongylus brasiliensis]